MASSLLQIHSDFEHLDHHLGNGDYSRASVHVVRLLQDQEIMNQNSDMPLMTYFSVGHSPFDN
jgi:hypothetical protein